jgi:hypothetical protein
MAIDQSSTVPSAADLARMFPDIAGFGELDVTDLMAIDGGLDLGWLGAGIATWGGATFALLTLTNPITAPIGAGYLLIAGVGAGLQIAYAVTH